MTEPVVLLLHGGFLSRRMWTPQLAALEAAGARVIAPDLRGHGEQPYDGRPYAVADLAADALQRLDQDGIQQCVVAGHSLGGMAALELARRAPSRITGLALMDASAGLRSSPGEALLTSFVDASLRLSTVEWQAGLFARALTRYSPAAESYVRAELMAQAATPLRYRAAWRALSRYQPEALRAIACPVVILAGARAPGAERLARALAARLAHAKVVIIPDAGHLAGMDQPEAVHDAIVDLWQAPGAR